VFSGKNSYSIDEKGRVPIPPEFVKELGGGKAEVNVVLTIGPNDDCILVYPENEWESFREELEKLPLERKIELHPFIRLIFSRVVIRKIDAQRRISIPEEMQEKIGLGKKAVVIGCNKSFEIWDEEKWKEAEVETEKELHIKGKTLFGTLLSQSLIYRN